MKEMDKAQGHCDGRIATYPRPRSFARHGGSLKDGSWMDCVEEGSLVAGSRKW